MDKLWQASSHSTNSFSDASHQGQSTPKRRRATKSASNPATPTGKRSIAAVGPPHVQNPSQDGGSGAREDDKDKERERERERELGEMRSKMITLMAANLDLQQRNKELRDENQRMLSSSVRAKRASAQYAKALDRLVMVQYKLKQLEASSHAARLLSACARLGRPLWTREGALRWEDGEAWTRCRLEQTALKLRIESLHRELIRTKRRLKTVAKTSSSVAVTKGAQKETAAVPAACALQEVLGKGQELRERVAVLRLQLRHARTRRRAVGSKVSAMQQERVVLARQVRIQQMTKESKFLGNATTPVILHRRYLLLSLLGKGGFSEVYDAFDLLELRHVACKVHRVCEGWAEEQKQRYVRHVTREYNIHRHMRHPRVVSFFDKFELDGTGFCTVMDSCTGGDLNEVLKQRGPLSEDEAKSIVRQVLTGLAYLSSLRRKVIHYDLKPANILFTESGSIQLSDFGLAKLVGDGANPMASLNLSVHGAGTYWYLPPECFPPYNRASPAVDVWSVGIITYEVLTGRRPFGHAFKDSSRFWKERSKVWAKGLQFPAEPYVTDSAKRFISLCLTVDDKLRPDVLSLLHDPWLKHTEDVFKVKGTPALKTHSH